MFLIKTVSPIFLYIRQANQTHARLLNNMETPRRKQVYLPKKCFRWGVSYVEAHTHTHTHTGNHVTRKWHHHPRWKMSPRQRRIRWNKKNDRHTHTTSQRGKRRGKKRSILLSCVCEKRDAEDALFDGIISPYFSESGPLFRAMTGVHR